MKTLILPPETQLRDYQAEFLRHAFAALEEGNPGDRFLYAAPTGSGKSVMELALYAWLDDAVLVTPRLEIVAGMLQKGGHDTSAWSDDKLAAVALEHRITTPIRLRNLLAAGTLPWRPTAVIFDECHHFIADSYKDVMAYLGEKTRVVGLTATPFRGTPKGTQEFLAQWTDVTWVLDYPAAAERGVIAVPSCTIWPLMDDDLVTLTNGEIQVSGAAEMVMSRLDEVVRRCEGFGCERGWDRPTIFAVPNTATALELAARLTAAGLPADAVTQDTPRAERNRIFAACERGETAIVQIDVVSEGVDLNRLRRLIDLRPTMSPVKWLQQVGRIARPVKPGEPPPEYICCNRNLERHAYLYKGLIPPSAVREAQQAFKAPSRRAAGARTVGLESFGRFSSADVPFADGVIGSMYQITAVEDFTRRDYAIILHPCYEEPLYASRENIRDGSGAVAWGKWCICEPITDVSGFKSAPAKRVTEKQLQWWQRSAKRFGLDPNGEVTTRNFAVLPVLSDLGVKVGG